MATSIAMTYPSATMAGAEALASNGQDFVSVLVRSVGGGFSLREERNGHEHRDDVPQRHDGGR